MLEVTVRADDLAAVLQAVDYMSDRSLTGPVDRMGDALALARMKADLAAEAEPEEDAVLIGHGRATIYGDYVAPAIAAPSGPWHVQGDESDVALCGKRLTGYLRRMNLHVCLLECSRCMDLGRDIYETKGE